MRCSECGQRLTGEEKYCTRCGKEVDVSGWEDKHKTAKWIAIGFCVLAVLLISSVIILYFKHNKVENTNKWIQTEENEIQENIVVESEGTDYQGMVEEYDEKEEIDDDFSEQIVTKSNERDDITDQNVSEHMVDFRITASSVLQEKGYNYDPRNMADLDMTTCWADGTSGNGVGEYITFLSNSAKSVRGIAIAPGFNKSEELFSKNGVPIKVCLEYTGPEIEKETLVLAMEDYSYSSEMLYFDFEEEKRITECKVTILEVRNGSKYDDCCISEMFLYY